jgi:hypothetical protein
MSVMDAIGWITAVAGLVGLFIEIRGKFPQYRRYIWNCTLIAFGAFLAVLVNRASFMTLDPSVKITLQDFTRVALVGGTGILAVACFLTSLFTKDSAQKAYAGTLGSSATGFLILLLMFTQFSPYTASGNGLTLAFDEQVELAAIARQKGNFDRSLQLLQDGLKHYNAFDERRIMLQRLITETEKLQESAHLKSFTATVAKEPKTEAN